MSEKEKKRWADALQVRKTWDRSVKKVLKGENGNERDWDRKNRMRKGKEQRDWNEHSFSNRRHQSPQINPFFSNCHFILLLFAGKSFCCKICWNPVQRLKHTHHRYLPLSSGPRQKGRSCNLFGKTSPPSWSSGDSGSEEIDLWILLIVHYCTLFLCCLDGEI